MIVGRHIFLRKWKRGLQISLDAVQKIPVWIQLYIVPLEYWNVDGLSCLASAVGVSLFADAATEGKQRINYARICVELDASKPLVKEFEVDVFNDSLEVAGTTTIKVFYQWRPQACGHCKVFGHSDDTCPYLLVAAKLTRLPQAHQRANNWIRPMHPLMAQLQGLPLFL